MTDIERDDEGERRLSPREQLEPQIEAMRDDLGALSLHLDEIATWNGLTGTIGMLVNPPLAWGFRSGTGEFVVASLDETFDPERLPFEPCDKEQWHQLVGRDRPMPKVPS